MRILLLQGPIGGFFAYLARHLESAGHSTLKIDFNGGDWLFSRAAPHRIAYRKGHRRWRNWLRATCDSWKPDVVLVFGDQRPIHRVAKRVAAERGIRFMSFEEGYLRPNHVTLEDGGNNANSPVLRSWPPAAPEPAAPEAPPMKPSFKYMAWKAMFYYIAKTLGAPFFPGAIYHRRRALLAEYVLWNRTYIRLLLSRRADQAATTWLSGTDHPSYFLLALQVHDDLQLLRYGKGWRNTPLIRAVCKSFAENASPACRLVIKVHPQDRGHRSYIRRIRIEAKAQGIADRVIALQSGALAPVIRNARGLITINSTSGIAAIEAGIPVFTLGDAIYSRSRLVQNGGLDKLAEFWRNPIAPDAAAAKCFINHIKLHSLIPGGFYDQENWPALAEAVAKRIAP